MGFRPTQLNLIANYTFFTASMLVGLVVNPLLHAVLGTSSFGAWKACQRIFDVATAPDGGAAQAVKWKVAHASQTASAGQMQQTVGAAIAVWALWLPPIALASVAVWFALPYLIAGLTPDEVAALQVAGIVLSVNALVAGLIAIPTAVLIGGNRGYVAFSISTVVLLLGNAGGLAAASLGWGIAGVALATLVAAVLGAAVTTLVVRRFLPWWGAARPSRTDVRELSHFSGWALMWSYTQRALLSSELIIISIIAGASVVTLYNFTSYVAQFGLIACMLTTNAFLPRLGATVGSGAVDAAGELVAANREITLATIAIVGAGMLAFNGAFVSLWVGDALYLGDTANVLIVAAFVQLAHIRWNGQIQDTALNIRSRALIGVISTLLGFALALGVYSVTGSLMAMYIALLVGRLPMTITFPLITRAAIPATTSVPATARAYAGTAAVLVVGYLLHYVLHPASVLDFLWQVAAGSIVFCLGAYALIFSAPQRSSIRAVALQLVGKRP